MNLRNVQRAASAVAVAGLAATGLALGAGTASADPHNEVVKQYDNKYDCQVAHVSEQFKHRHEGVQYYCAQNDKGWVFWVRLP